MKVLITGGGTGGHIYPGIAIAKQISHEHEDWEVRFAGRTDCIEGEVVPKEGYEISHISIAGFERYYNVFQKAKVALRMFVGLKDALSLMNKYKPDIVIGTGGFVSGPVVLAANMKKIPTLIHEQNALPGFTTKTLSKWASTVCATFENTKDYVKYPERVVVTGNPVRREFSLYTREIARKTLGVNDEQKLVVSFGGSLGAKVINDAVISLMEYYSDEDVVFYHIAGKAGYEGVKTEAENKGFDKNKNIHILEYSHEMPVLLNAADIVISRSGATSISEITYVGAVGIFVPYPYAADDHQTKNALAVVNNDAGFMIADKDLNGESLIREVKKILTNDELRKTMSKNSFKMGKRDAAQKIVAEAQRIVKY